DRGPGEGGGEEEGEREGRHVERRQRDPPPIHAAAAVTPGSMPRLPAPEIVAPVGWPAARRKLFTWFDAHHRPMPWRQDRDPYRIWVSEVMLQQTTVAAVVPYFTRFVAAFPTLAALAVAPEDRVLKLWEGLGYYRRARHLHAAAKVLRASHGDTLP